MLLLLAEKVAARLTPGKRSASDLLDCCLDGSGGGNGMSDAEAVTGGRGELFGPGVFMPVSGVKTLGGIFRLREPLPVAEEAAEAGRNGELVPFKTPLTPLKSSVTGMDTPPLVLGVPSPGLLLPLADPPPPSDIDTLLSIDPDRANPKRER